MGTSSLPGGECLNFGNPQRIPPAAAAKIAPGPIAQNRRGHRNTKPLAIRRCGGTAVKWKIFTRIYFHILSDAT